MTPTPATLLCWFTVPFAVVNSVHHARARYPHPGRWYLHGVNLATATFFIALGSLDRGSWPVHTLQLWLPLGYYWWAYPWAGKTLHLFHPSGFSYDRQLIDWESKLFGNPSLSMARGRPRWLNEAMNFFYWSYYLYTPVLGVTLFARGDTQRLAGLILAVNLGYAVCYSLYPHFPLWGPRWALVSEGLLPQREQILDGYLFTAFMNRIMWSDNAHKGGAMPSAHSSTCVVFMIWCARIWGAPGALIGAFIGAMMFVSTIYGRYHYVIDVLVGSAIGLLAVLGADWLLAAL